MLPMWYPVHMMQYCIIRLTALCESIAFLGILLLLSFLLFALPTVYPQLVWAFLIAYVLYLRSILYHLVYHLVYLIFYI